MNETHPPAALPTDSDSLLTQICADFPQCFSEEASQVRPIAIGTKALLLAHYQATWGEAVPHLADWLKVALKAYTHSLAYAKASVLDAPRITLQGDVDGAVDAHSAEFGQYLCRKHRWRQARETRRAQLTQRPPQEQTPVPTASEATPAVVKDSAPKRPKLTLKKTERV